MKFHADATLPTSPLAVFVFGSNTRGRHGAGAAKIARERFGAVVGRGVGRSGRSYAIPTKNDALSTLSLDAIASHVKVFLFHAADHPADEFFVTRVGCGLAGYRDKDIAPMFKGAPDNCSFAEQWRALLEDDNGKTAA